MRSQSEIDLEAAVARAREAQPSWLSSGLRRDDALQHCTLSVTDEPITLNARVTRNEDTIGLWDSKRFQALGFKWA